jgi:activator of HSP90 ATPase
MKIREVTQMMSDRKDPALTASQTTRRQMMVVTAAACSGVALASRAAWAAAIDDGISHTSESIHQEPVFKASRKRVYQALTDASQFDHVVKMSAAAQSMKSLGDKPAEISREPGGAFSLFGGYVTGRQIELIPDQRIVQAWRSGIWDPGAYSIARFELVEQGSGTKIIFDHRGFPDGTAQHLAEGWKGNYWEPLAKFLGE